MVIPDLQSVQEMTGLPVMQVNYLPMPFPFYPTKWNNVRYYQPSFSAQTKTQQKGHSTVLYYK